MERRKEGEKEKGKNEQIIELALDKLDKQPFFGKGKQKINVQKFFANLGVETLAVGVEGFEGRYRSDLEKYARLIKEAGIPQED